MFRRRQWNWCPVCRVFSPYFHADAPQVLGNPRAHVVIDDGRRFLERSSQKFDAVIIDPPPPVGAAASSLLYSRDFYGVLKARLSPGGILQQWLPNGDEVDRAAVAKSLRAVFWVRQSVQVNRGLGLASACEHDQPIPDRTAAELVARMPAPAVKDMMEWGPAATPEEQFQRVSVDRDAARLPDQRGARYADVVGRPPD